MLDFSHIPINNRSNFQAFYNAGNATAQSWQVWNKPRGISNIFITCIGAGGGGGPGAAAGANASALGGGSGGSGGITNILIYASLIPDVLYISPGYPGPAGAAGGASYVSIQPSTTAAYTICFANGGGGAAAQAAGSAGGIATTTSMILGSYGFYTVVAGVIGLAGVSAAVGQNVTWGSSIVSSGASGGGKSNATGFNGGQITGAGLMPTVIGGTGGAATATSGRSGLSFTQPFMFCGGTGGGGLNAVATAGSGGDGGFGCGGGGGGAFVTGGSSIGGRGGSGLILIWGF